MDDARAAVKFTRAAKRLARLAGVAGLGAIASAHLGSPDTWFQGNAGPYPVRVVVRLPGVVPGLAQIDITVTGEGVQEVTAQPVVFDAGRQGAPPADVAKPVAGRPGLYHAELWFMQPGSFSVHVKVTGREGSGTVVVPVAAIAERQIPLYPWLGRLLLALGLLLFIGAVTIVRAAVSDGITAPGVPLSKAQRRAGAVYSVFGAGVIGLGLFGARGWWQSVERDYRAELYQPFTASASVDTTGGGRVLRFVITDSVWQTRRPRAVWERFTVSPLIPDHGKLMHLFLMREGDPSAFAHLHPVSQDSMTFTSPLGTLPQGRYRAYADVVHETGMPQTMVAQLDVPAAPATPPAPATSTGSVSARSQSDLDDVVFVGAPAGATYTLPDGATVTWEAKPDTLVAQEDARLTFIVKEKDGSTARLAPYLGMPGHAVVYRTDGQVYIHLHPNGTTSMVAQRALGSRQTTDTLPGMLARRLATDSMGMSHASLPTFDGTLSFPYAFPQPGQYRVWVQLRRGALRQTAPFEILVR